ncbi:MAG: phage holin family protein [Candidatus Nanopelagicales bacterium]
MTSVTTDKNEPTEPTVRELVSSAASDVSTLITGQIDLAKAELKQSASQAGAAFGLLIAAAVTIFLAVVFLLVTLAYVLVAVGLPVWAGFGIVTLVLIILGVIMGLVGKRRAGKVKAPEETIKELEETKRAFANRNAEESDSPRGANASN